MIGAAAAANLTLGSTKRFLREGGPFDDTLAGYRRARGMGAMLHRILSRLAAYLAVVVAAGLLFLAGASVYALMWPKPVEPFGQMGR
jgi:hypothetical protein